MTIRCTLRLAAIPTTQQRLPQPFTNEPEPMRDYEREHQDTAERKYAYDFDHILRRFMMRSFGPLLPQGKALELGCYQGEFTQ